jgi:hypothetical protein
MAKRDQVEIRARITIEHPVPGVLHSLQSKERVPLDPKRSEAGEPLSFDFPLRIGPGPKYFGDQVQREGPERRFAYIRVGQAAGDHASPWSRRMKIDIDDTDPALLDEATKGGILVLTVDGTAKDGSPVCATVRPVAKKVVAA